MNLTWMLIKSYKNLVLKKYLIGFYQGHCVMVYNEEGVYVRSIGGESITNYPNGIDISDAGDVLIGDSHGNRFHVAVFSHNGSLLSEFECPHVKVNFIFIHWGSYLRWIGNVVFLFFYFGQVSRCCGLKITSEGFVVTLAKNNHYVLLLNTLYIT